jgi:hypothetical protein
MTARSRSRRTARALAAVATAVVACLGALSLADASAATLGVTATKDALGTAARCASSQVTVDMPEGGARGEVVIAGLTASEVAACGSAVVTLRLLDAAGTVTTLTAQPASTITLPSTVPATSVVAAMVDVGGFALTTTLNLVAPVAQCTVVVSTTDLRPVAGASCQVSATWNESHWQSGNPGYYKGQITLTISGGAAYARLIDVDLSQLVQAPAEWSWSGATAPAAENSNLVFPQDSGELPRLRVATYGWWTSGTVTLHSPGIS